MAFLSMKFSQVIQFFHFKAIHYWSTGDWEQAHQPGNENIHQIYKRDKQLESWEGEMYQEPSERM